MLLLCSFLVAGKCGGEPGTEPPPFGCTGQVEHRPGFDTETFQHHCTAFAFPYYQFSGSLGVLLPASNQRHCTNCHNLAARGDGTGMNLFRIEPGDKAPTIHHTFTGTDASGKTLPGLVPISPSSRTFVVRAPSIFGLGLLEEIPNVVFEILADPDDVDGDGISGRVTYDRNGRTGRFGFQNQHGTLFDFVEQAFDQELGFDPWEIADAAEGADPSFLERLGSCGSNLVSCVSRFIAGTQLKEVNPMGLDNESVQRGAEVFEEINCDGCHTIDLSTELTGWYSDELLHEWCEDFGSLNPDAQRNEISTPTLRHVSKHSPWMRGKATTLGSAIMFHCGPEVQQVIENYLALDVFDRNSLVSFLHAL